MRSQVDKVTCTDRCNRERLTLVVVGSANLHSTLEYTHVFCVDAVLLRPDGASGVDEITRRTT